MDDSSFVSLQTVAAVARALGELNQEMVYVGGAILGLYVTNELAEEPRPTMDIDLTVKVTTYTEMDNLRERLAKKGIYPAMEETVLYRYKYREITIDFIPCGATALGPTNSWLKPGFQLAINARVSGQHIRILPLSLFLASKWEAFQSRGGDPRMSHDFEDLVYLLHNSENVLPSFLQAAKEVKSYLQEMANAILSHPYRNEILECHLPYGEALHGRNRIVEVLKRMFASQEI